VIDLRSDICALPTEEMWAAMRSARLGWATLGDDESVLELEALGAGLLGKEACVLVPTCGMANLVALLVLAREGDAVVAEAGAHVLVSEELGIVRVARLEPRPVASADGRLDPAAADAALAGAALLWLENTHTRAGGTVLPVAATEELAAAARRHGARIHLDGARLPNAAAALGVPLAALAAPADTVAISLNKGLCAPFGALLAGPAAAIDEARVALRRLGGASVHKAGIGAAAGLVALRTMLDRLGEDNARARDLATLAGLDPARVETNIVLLDLEDAPAFVGRLAAQGVLALAVEPGRVRFVTHRLIGDEEVARAAAAVAAARP
jgi:threonine aldolase